MRKKRLLAFISLVGCLLASCSFRNQQSNVIWSKWHDNGDGTHSRHALNDITIQETDVHHFSLLKTNIEPTDVAPGKATYSCDECGAKEDRVLPPTGNYVFDQKVVAPQYLYEKCSEHSAIYYMSSKEGAYGNPDKLFEVSDIGDDYTEVDVAHSDGSQFIDTGVKNTTEYTTDTNYSPRQKLPSEYAEVEYIKSGPNQYIDTMYVIKSDKFKVSFKVGLDLNDCNGLTLFGSSTGTARRYSLCIYHNDDYGHGVFMHWVGDSERLLPITYQNGINEGTYEINSGIMSAEVNGASYSSPYEGQASNESNVHIFGESFGNESRETANGYTLYKYTLFEGGKEVRNMIPAVRISDNKAGLYDTVSKAFFSNNGIGEFEVGPVVNNNSKLPNSYTELTFIESNGTQYLDTEVSWVNETALTYEITLQFTTPGPSKGVGHHRANVGRDSSNNVILGSQTVSVNSQEKHTYKIEWEKGNYESSLLRTGYVDGVEVCSTHIQPLDDRNFFLFACTGWTTDDGKPPYSLENVRIFETKFYRDGNLIKHFVPAYYQNSSEYGMYEIIEGKWYENQGTGKFIGGEVVSSNTKTLSKYSEVEFIKFDGSQYIDTHIAEDAVWHFDLKWECSGERELMGYGGSSSEYFGISATGYYAIWDSSTIACGNRDNLIFTYSTSEVSLKVNDVYACQFGGHSDIQLGSFLIGGLSSFNTISYQNTGLTLFSVQAYSGETLLASYKPAIDNSTGKAGLYDLITNEFLDDANEGTFETGAVVGNVGSEIAQETEDLDSIEPVALPVSYHQLAYINVAGYHTIPTKLIGELKIDMVANFKNVHASQSFGYNADTTVFSIDKNGKYYPTESRVGNKDTISLDVGDTTENKYTATLNGTKIIDSSFTFKNKKDDLKLFSINGKGGLYGKVYSLKIFKKNVLKMNLVPVKNIYLNEIGFYDTVSESFLTSSNNVEFIGGSDMNIDIDMSNINMFISRYSNEKILQKADMSDFKVFNSKNELIRDFVPALRNSDGKLGFFEVVEKKFYESPIGNEFTYDNKVGHMFESEKTLVSPTHSTNGEKETVCKICGRHVHEKIDRTAYQVTFQLPSFIQTVKIFQELDPSKYEIATVGYTRNVSTYNYSKVNAWICFEVVMDEDITLVVTASNGKVRKLTNTKYEITNIVHDCVITIAKKA